MDYEQFCKEVRGHVDQMMSGESDPIKFDAATSAWISDKGRAQTAQIGDNVVVVKVSWPGQVWVEASTVPQPFTDEGAWTCAQTIVTALTGATVSQM